MKNIRRSIYQGIVSFIEKTTMYNLEDIAKIIQESHTSLHCIMQNRAFPISRNAELNLVKLYAISLDLHHLYKAYGKDDDANL